MALLDFIEGLPAASRYQAAIANDEEVAQMILDMEEENGGASEWSPPLSEYDLNNTLLSLIVDSLASLQATIVAVNGGKPSKPEPLPRPKTAVDRLREKRSQERQQVIVDIFAPHVKER